MIEIDVVPSALLVAAQFASWAGALEDMRDPLKKAITEVVIPSISKNFNDEGNPPWEDLSDETRQRRLWLGYDEGPILQRSGSLRSAATNMSSWDVDGETAQMESPDSPYGMFHQNGTRNMPERPFAMFQEEDLERIQEVFGDWIMEQAASKAGF